MVLDWVRAVVDTGDLEQIQFLAHVASARDTVFVQSELAFLNRVICRDYPLACLLVQRAEERDPLFVQFILDIQRALDIAHVHAF